MHNSRCSAPLRFSSLRQESRAQTATLAVLATTAHESWARKIQGIIREGTYTATIDHSDIRGFDRMYFATNRPGGRLWSFIITTLPRLLTLFPGTEPQGSQC